MTCSSSFTYKWGFWFHFLISFESILKCFLSLAFSEKILVTRPFFTSISSFFDLLLASFRNVPESLRYVFLETRLISLHNFFCKKPFSWQLPSFETDLGYNLKRDCKSDFAVSQERCFLKQSDGEIQISPELSG